MRNRQGVRQGWGRTPQDLRDMCAAMSDAELAEMLDRCLSTRLDRIAREELSARRNAA